MPTADVNFNVPPDEECGGCRAAPDTAHGDGCDWARCPDCGDQLIFHQCQYWPDTADGPDRPAWWYGVDPRDEVARARGWWTTVVGIDHPVENDARVLIAAVKGCITWNPHEQRYLIGDIDETAIDEAEANR